MALGSTYRTPLTTRQLLISVQNAEEAQIAFQSGVAWVDLKNPRAGALGQPDRETCQAFIEVAKQFPSSRISLALGEFDCVDWQLATEYLNHFAVGKVGLAGRTEISHEMVERLSSFPGQIVPALYADWARVGSASPACVVQLADKIHAPFVLVDTHTKDGRNLLDWMSLEQLRDLQSQVQGIGASLVIAGSLRSSDWPALQQLNQVTVGIRGAVCQTPSDRGSSLNRAAIEQWLAWSGKE